MKTKQLIFVTLIIIISLGCFGLMVRNFDTLSRYPYQNDKASVLIKENLTKDEIEYIIEYSIEPNHFLRYIEAEDFNVFNSDLYNQLDDISWDLSPMQVVELAEFSKDKISIDELSEMLKVYSGITVFDWMINRPSFDKNASLTPHPFSVEAIVNDYLSVFTTNGTRLVKMDEQYYDEKQDIYLNVDALDQMEAMCAAISDDLKIQPCGGLKVASGYRSYNDEMIIYQEALNDGKLLKDYDLPGHSEHQLGLAIDFILDSNDEFKTSIQAEWLQKYSSLYGFVQTYTSQTQAYTGKTPRDNHYRYYGLNLAQQMQPPFIAQVESDDQLEEISTQDEKGLEE